MTPALPDFEKALRGFSDAIVRRKGVANAEQGAVAGAVADYLLAVHSRIPDYLRLPFRVLILIFDASPLPMRGRPFHRLDSDQRIAWISAWEGSRLELCRRLMEMYGSLALFGLYSELHGADYADEPASRPVAAHDRFDAHVA
ncbi:hypothetical protein [Sphingobium sp.]|uniref:hypothetical protein n=1 Tax=Sphingobium sp. TaxID=1912891 RepID=UPI0035C71DEF